MAKHLFLLVGTKGGSTLLESLLADCKNVASLGGEGQAFFTDDIGLRGYKNGWYWKNA